MAALLETEALEISVARRVLVRDLAFAAQPGALIAILGPNGVGKTLTLHTLAGLRAARRGAVRIRGSDLRLIGQRERALRVGLLLQDQEDPFPTTVLETALDGAPRAPRPLAVGDGGGSRARPRCAARHGPRRRWRTDCARRCRAASGAASGSRRLLVQDPDVLLLDEPLNHLDPRHQFAVLAALRRLAAEGKAVIASLHDPVLAARHFDLALLLHGDGRWQLGPVAELLNAATLSELYAVPFERYRRATARRCRNGSCRTAARRRRPGSAGNVTPIRHGASRVCNARRRRADAHSCRRDSRADFRYRYFRSYRCLTAITSRQVKREDGSKPSLPPQR